MYYNRIFTASHDSSITNHITAHMTVTRFYLLTLAGFMNVLNYLETYSTLCTYFDIMFTCKCEAEKKNHFLFMNKFFNMQRNSTKFRTLIVTEYSDRYYLFNFWNLQ